MAPSTDLPRDPWRTSSYSNNGGNCVEVAASQGLVGVRDTRHRAGAALTFSPQAWQRFARSLKG
ncbi:MAG TPA: DUF397 domain-containing protein [Trebonia sp.]|nr:DUF397 domain-containing protein [Trebonia sp.]